MNSVLIIGNLGTTPVLTTKGDTRVATFRLAVKTGDRTDWIQVALFGALATLANDQLQTGDTVGVSGSFRSSSWTGQDGGKRSSVEVVASSIDFLRLKKWRDQDEHQEEEE